MHVMLIADAEARRREAPMLDRLAVALAAVDVEITRVVPRQTQDAQDSRDRVTVLPTIVTDLPRGRIFRRSWVQSIVSSVDRRVPDAIFAVGKTASSAAVGLARRWSCPLLIDVASRRDALAAGTARWRGAKVIFVAETDVLLALLRQRLDAHHAVLAPVGVARPGDDAVATGSGSHRSIAYLNAGCNAAAIRQALQGLQPILDDVGPFQGCLELHDGDHELWRAAQRLGLLEVLTPVQEAEDLRRLVAACDVVVVPERETPVRTVILEAMANGATVIAPRGTVIDGLVADQTAVLIDSEESQAWAGSLRRVLRDDALRERLGSTAAMAIETDHTSWEQATALKSIVERLVPGPTASGSPV